MYKAVFFDLDGTLLKMDNDLFINHYFTELTKKLAPLGYDPKLTIKAIWDGTKAMVLNDGSRCNEEVFWDCFNKIIGKDCTIDKPVFEDFYKNEFIKAKEATSSDSSARSVVDYLKSKNIRVVLATNPIFPQIATINRTLWADFDVSEFEYVTTYENSHSCKPNLRYYEELLNKLNLDAKDCLMVGNDVAEDMVAQDLGFDTFLITDCLLNKYNLDYSKYKKGNFSDLLEFLKANI